MTSETIDGGRRDYRQLVIAGTVGNVMEWYDFAVYGYFVRPIGHAFFPADSETASLLAAYGTFAVGFLMRPLGAAVFGYVADRTGRAYSLIWSVVAMAAPSFLIGLLPTYQEVGLVAPLLMLLCRVLQGFAVGGEYIGSVVFLMERAPPGQRGVAGSWPSVGSIFGFLLGSALGAAVFGAMPHAEVFAWGWRLPFLLGVAVGLTGYFIRRRIRPDEPPSREGFPLAEAVRRHPVQMVLAIGLSVVNGVGFYLMFSYIVTWLQIYARVTPHVSLLVNSINMVIMMPVTLWGGWLSDKVGSKPVLVVSAAGLLVLSWPSLLLMHSGVTVEIFLGQLVFCVLVGVYSAVNPVIVADMFPAAERSSAASVTYNVTLAVAGGTAPLVAIWLIDTTGDPMAMAFYLMLAAAISTTASLLVRRRYAVLSP